jgi:large subunit ribosomal protein L16
MLLAPSRPKYRKQHRGRMKGRAHRGATIAFGEFGLQALEPCWLEARQIEAARIALTRYMKRGGKVWIRVFPDKPISGKPAETRMGSGKGALDHWVAVVKPGRIIFEIGGVSEEVAKEAIRLAGHKLPINCRFVKREEAESVEA